MTTLAPAQIKNRIEAPAKTATKAIAKPIKKPVTKTSSKPNLKPTTKTSVIISKSMTTDKKIAATAETPKVISKPVVKTLIAKPIKAKKIKLVRDSFTIPKPEYLILDNLKLRAADLNHPIKKSELLRAGIKALAAMTDAQLLIALKAVPMLKTGRPSK